MKKLLYFVAIFMVAMAFAGCNASNEKLEGKWRIITDTMTEIYGSEQSEPQTVNLEDKFHYWEFLEDGTFAFYYIKEDGQKKYEVEGTWTRNGSKVDLKVKDVTDVQVEGTIMQLTAAKLVFQMKQIYGENSIVEVYDCRRE